MKINDDIALIMIDKIISYFQKYKEDIERGQRVKDHPQRVLPGGNYNEIEKTYYSLGES